MERTGKLTAAGIMTIIAGCFGIGVGSWIALMGDVIGGMAKWDGMAEMAGMAGLAGILGMIGGAGIGLGIVALIGGIFALQRRLWGLALAGTICAIPLVPPGTVLGIISLIFVSKRRKEFA